MGDMIGRSQRDLHCDVSEAKRCKDEMHGLTAVEGACEWYQWSECMYGGVESIQRRTCRCDNKTSGGTYITSLAGMLNQLVLESNLEILTNCMTLT